MENLFYQMLFEIKQKYKIFIASVLDNTDNIRTKLLGPFYLNHVILLNSIG